ncbi:hypothetical protein Ciccas_004480 [Cichlidogyrus casuarinus]|uniref:Uncharacterized protein n=1 Tax=Cichlidogyrus casuarinus TaxID=1844966 RepID=A0ABD2QCB6_9PLAT
MQLAPVSELSESLDLAFTQETTQFDLSNSTEEVRTVIYAGQSIANKETAHNAPESTSSFFFNKILRKFASKKSTPDVYFDLENELPIPRPGSGDFRCAKNSVKVWFGRLFQSGSKHSITTPQINNHKESASLHGQLVNTGPRKYAWRNKN